MTKREAYVRGFEDGLQCFSWMKDGVTYVGTTGKTLKDALKEVDTLWSFDPPKEKENV